MGWCTLVDIHHDYVGTIQGQPKGFAKLLTDALSSGDRSDYTLRLLRGYGVTLLDTRDSYREDALIAARREADELRAEVQTYVDSICHYRNLSIALGAKPEDMVNSYDRGLCERGLNTDGEGWSIEDARKESAETWRENDELRARVAVLAGLIQRWLDAELPAAGVYLEADSRAALTSTDRAAGERWQELLTAERQRNDILRAIATAWNGTLWNHYMLGNIVAVYKKITNT